MSILRMRCTALLFVVPEKGGHFPSLLFGEEPPFAPNSLRTALPSYLRTLFFSFQTPPVAPSADQW